MTPSDVGGLIWPVTRHGGVEPSQNPPPADTARGGASCGGSPGQGTNSQVIIVQQHGAGGSFCLNHTSFSWGLLAVPMELYLKNCLFLTAKSQCCSLWDLCSAFLWLKTNWVHKVCRNASVLPAVSLGESLSTLDFAMGGN